MKAIILISSVVILLSCNKDNSSRELILESRIDSLEKQLEILRDTKFESEFNYEYKRTQTRKRLTDDEIRELRKRDPNHIYRTSGRRPVLSEEELFEQRADEYIEDNYEEILDRYR